MTYLGLIGGPLVMVTCFLVIFDVIPRGGALQSISGLVEGAWELSLSIYCIVKGFRASSPLFDETVTQLPESARAVRQGS
jgi:hypothetical protein